MPAAGPCGQRSPGVPTSWGKCALGPEVKRRGLPPPACLFLCNAVVTLGESSKQIKEELLNWWVVLGGKAVRSDVGRHPGC